MRSSPSRLRALLYSAPAALVIALVAACADDSATTAAKRSETGGDENASGDPTVAPSPNELIGDSAAPPADAYRGSPLCHITTETCDPDDDGTKQTYSGTVKECAVKVTPDSGVITNPRGCRLAGASATPECFEAANFENTEGAKCEKGADCAPGFDCIAASGTAYCRRYCCSGSCGSNRSQTGAETFCDVQKIQGTMTKAPVCMPIKSCELFLVGECAESETCSVVTDDGTTGCVANGSAKAGESCDTEHCNAGLTCLGQAGNRKCLQLCRTTKAGPSCATNQICKASTIFTDPTLGVCAPAQ